MFDSILKSALSSDLKLQSLQLQNLAPGALDVVEERRFKKTTEQITSHIGDALRRLEGKLKPGSLDLAHIVVHTVSPQTYRNVLSTCGGAKTGSGVAVMSIPGHNGDSDTAQTHYLFVDQTRVAAAGPGIEQALIAMSRTQGGKR